MVLFRNHPTFRVVAFLLVTTLLIWIEISVTHTAAFSRRPAALSLAVLFDLVFVPSALFYWLVARPFQLAINRLVLVALLMLRVALFILPQTALLPNQLWPLVFLFIEGTVLVMAGLRIRSIMRTYRQLRPQTDAETALQSSLATVFGERGAGFIIGEGLMLYYTLLGWRLRPNIPIGVKPLTTHHQSGQIALTVGLLLVGLIEGAGVHLLLTRWNPTVAVWITALSAYGMLFFVADALATVKRPSSLTDHQLQIRLGIRWRATIPRAVITHVALIHEKPAKQPGHLNGAFLTAPNVLLTFNEPVWFTGPYGIRKQVRAFSFFVDNRAEFVQALT